MLPTVLSRCLQFNLRPMAPATVRAHLARVLTAEGVPFDDGALRILGRAARGSMRDGLSLTDQAIAYGGGRVEESTVRAMLGSVERTRALALMQALAARDAAALLGVLTELRERGVSAAGTLEEIAQLCQQAALEQALPGVLDDADPDSADARTLAAGVPADELQLLYSIALHGRGELSLMSDEYGALTMVLLRFLAFPAEGEAARPSAAPRALPLRAPAPPSASLPARSAAPEPAPPPGPPLAAASTASAPASTPAATAQDAADPALAERWDAIVRDLIERGSVQALVRELAWSSALLAIDELTTPPTWRLAVERDALRGAPMRDKLAAALAAAVGEPLQLELVAAAAADSPARREAAARARRQAEAEAAIRSDPVVRELLAQFEGARIVPGSIKPV
jgi:DNA polymerase-3 subunit gamma/tau